MRSIGYILKVKGVTGVERHVRDLCKELCGRFVLYVFVLEKPDHLQDAYVESLKALGVTVYRFSVAGNLSWAAARSLRAKIVHHQIDIVHTHLMAADIYGWYLKRQLPELTWLSTIHNVHSFASMKAWVRFAYVKCLRRADRVIYVAEFVAQVLAPLIKPLASVVIHNCVPDVSARQPGDAQKILFVGRLITLKGCDDLLRAFKLLKPTSPHLTLTIVGEGPEMDKLKTLVNAPNLASSVHFIGYQADTAPFFREAGIFVLPSRSEGLPLTLIEAMAHGKAIVANRITSVSECVSDNVSGLLVNQGDVYSLATTIRRLIEDPALCVRLAAGARAAYETNFQFSMMAERYAKLYEACG
jgi:glycosyltransferase involved in cell wall biosynthesis